MNINKISTDYKIAESISRDKDIKKENKTMFSDIFKTAITNVKETQYDVESKEYLMAIGKLENVHDLPIAEAKAALSVELLVTLRNKGMEAYNDLMRMNI